MFRVLSSASTGSNANWTIAALAGAVLLALAAIIALSSSGFGAFRTATVHTLSPPVAQGSCTTTTQLLWNEPAPEEEVGGGIPEEVELVRYPSDPGPLKGWLLKADGPGPHPTLVYFHGGFSWSAANVEVTRPWVERGWNVFLPTVRGENGNPGTYQLLCGEVDDAANAVQWIAAQPFVDPARIVTFGHSLGGGISALLALRSDLPIAASGSCSAMYFEEVLQGWGPMVPFDPNDAKERQMRLLVSQLDQLKRPHVAYMGKGDVMHVVIAPARAAAAALGAPLTVIEVEGDHQTSLQPALDAFWTSDALQHLAGSAR